MSYRVVTKDDVGKMIEVRDNENYEWKVRELEHVLSRPDHTGMQYLVWGEDKHYPVQYRYARIRTSPLPDGWLPDDWRVLGDEEVCRLGDKVLFKTAIKFPFEAKETQHDMLPKNEFLGQIVKCLIDNFSHHLCVVRSRWRPATKDDVGKTVHSKSGRQAILKIIVDADFDGYDAVCIGEHIGWCLARLSELRVENEGWHVTT